MKGRSEFDAEAVKACNRWYVLLSSQLDAEVVKRMCNTIQRPRKHVESKVIETKRIEGKKE